jgi:hypothetical protein
MAATLDGRGCYECIRLAEVRKRLRSPPPRPFASLRMLEMLAWKSTSPSNVPCQPIVLTRDKM